MQRLVPALVSGIEECRIVIDADNYDATLLKVASLSANGDEPMAQKFSKV